MNYLLLVGVAVLLSTGQLMFKISGIAIRGLGVTEAFRVLVTFPIFYISVFLYAIATVMWIIVLSRMPLVIAYPWLASATVTVPLIGWLYFGEIVGPMFWPGICLIAIGLILTQVGGSN